MKRREFIKKASIGSAVFAGTQLYDFAVPVKAHALDTSGGIGIEEALYILGKGKEKNVAPEIRPEIMNNPRAVFLIETHVDARKDDDGFFTEAAPQLEETGKQVVSELFVRGTRKGGQTFIKPNFTYVAPEYMNRTCGVLTSPDFIAGFIEGLHDINNTNIMIGDRMPNGVRNHREAGIYDVMDPKEIDILEANYAEFSHYTKNELNWSKTSNSLIWKNIPYWRPIGDRDTFLINMPTLKVHTVGLTTLAVKNLQGAVPPSYVLRLV